MSGRGPHDETASESEARAARASAAGGRLGYRPELDGLRALSVLVVVVHHVPGPLKAAMPGAWLGVDVFFAISGALITRLLLLELERSGTLRLGSFYVRRLRRLYPAMLTMIVAACLAALVLRGSDFVLGLLPDALIAALYLAGFVVHERAMPLLGHTWSLSIEELFYLVWPAATLLLARRGLRPLVLLLVLVVLLVPAWRMHLWLVEFASSARLYTSPDTRADAIAWGALAGVIAHRGLVRPHAPWLRALGSASALGLAALVLTASRAETWFAIWGYSLTAILSSIVVLHLFTSGSRWLSSPTLTWIGKRSYGIYLWHVPVLELGLPLGVPAWILLLVTLAFTVLSYRYVEQPLRAPSGA